MPGTRPRRAPNQSIFEPLEGRALFCYEVPGVTATHLAPLHAASLSVEAAAAEVIVDNTAASRSGSWTASSFDPGFYGTNYYHDGNAGKGTKSVTYAAVLPAAGQYEVFTRHASSTNRATAVPIDVTSVDGVATRTVNQRNDGGQWVSLGTYAFNATGGSVRVRTTGTAGIVVADAVRFVAVSAPAPTPPASPTGLAAVAASPTSVNLTWSDASTDETSFQIERRAGAAGTFATLASVGSNVTAFTDAGAQPGTAYAYRVRAANAAGPSGYSAEASATTPTAVTGWTSADVGNVQIAGSSSESGGVVTVRGSGADIFGTADAFHFRYVRFTGDGTITARVTGVENTHPSAKAGVMFRESLAAGARHASALVEPSGIEFERRTATNGTTAYTKANAITAPYWVRVVRAGNTFTAFRSANGTSWTSMGSTTITMAAEAYVGLAVTAHDNTKLNTSTFDNVVAPAHTPPAPPPVAGWAKAGSLGLGRFEAQGAVANGKLYAMGGFYSQRGGLIDATVRSDAFDPATGTWSRVADMPSPVTHAGQTVDGGKIYLAGGFVGDHPGPDTNAVYVYNTVTNAWTSGPNLPASLGGGALVRLGRELHFFGGATRDADTFVHVDSTAHYVLNLGNTDATSDDATAWTTAPALPLARNHVAGVELNGKAYVIGGQLQGNELTSNVAQVDVYDPVAKSWSRAADLPSARGHVTASAFARTGRIMLVGGVLNGNGAAADVTEYDPVTNAWVALAPLPEGLQSPVAGYVAGKVVVAGGRTADITVATETLTLTLANTWAPGVAAPVSMGEVAAGIINNKLYVVGETTAATAAYDLATGTWQTSGLATRPYVGNHHSAEVINGKLYLFGGLGGSSSGRVQIYDPATNAWSIGATMPWAAGSVSTALINGKVYAAGGIVGSGTSTRAGVYNPANNTWTSIASMPSGRNHAAGTTDGTKFYVIGGRTGGNALGNGLNTVQVFDPATNTWRTSDNPAHNLAPLPIARGGMGRAVFFKGEIYVMGGETQNGPGATPNRVYDRVDVYNPSTNAWRLASPMRTPRHGIFPVLHAGRVFVAMGGVVAAGSSSAVLDIYYPE